MKCHYFIAALFQIFLLASLSAQDTIHLINPSFEGIPTPSGYQNLILDGWADCGKLIFPEESPPDILPTPAKLWGVSKPPKEGKTYLGLVTRYSKTYESVSQLLDHPLDTGKCYELTLFLALSEVYESPTPRTKTYLERVGNQFYRKTEMENFSHPVELLFWGGHDSCVLQELFAQSGAVSNHEWRKFRFEFSPKEPYSFITLAAYYLPGAEKIYNGHILIDGISPIIEVKCRK